MKVGFRTKKVDSIHSLVSDAGFQVGDLHEQPTSAAAAATARSDPESPGPPD